MVRRAHAAGLEALALTDHDTVAGVPQAAAVGQALEVRVVAGCEFSAHADWGEVHLLGYFLPPDDPALEGFLTRWREARQRRAARMVQALAAHGVAIPFEAVLAQAAGGAVGRPHVARVLARRGVVASEQEAFDRWLANGRPAYVPKELPTVADVARLVHQVGGVLVAAHLKDRGTEGTLKTFRAQGVDGVEVRHPSHDQATEQRLLGLARRLELAVTGGSDWHGDTPRRDHSAALGGLTVPVEWLTRLEEHREGTAGTR